ncbi:hypothetical protein [Phocaeicola vulgatus]|uniref:hypothetical protein n=4 Tax=Phocaeicola TaxID=909656 RepID=UPI002108E6EC|nr:hypothetical protein [Phocaeicola vulgatus]MCQ5230623.1 hypothetical protein [Phocaeicola vulgatus]
MSDLNLENIVGFKAVDKNGNERQVTVDEMTELVSARIVSAASEISTFAAAAAAGTDEFEDQLPQSDTFSWLRTLDGSKNPTLTSSSAAAKVLGELIGNATSNKSGLMSSGMVPLELSKDNNQYCKISVFMPNAGSINESVISVTNVGGDSFSVAVSMIRWNANKVFCKLINGTKISNINMYYTVDTEKFCFYIKANWYAKIIVSRLGLVNTSKIESINAIPSGAIEVPIS